MREGSSHVILNSREDFTSHNRMSSLRTYWTFARPFTLVPPMTGIFSGCLLGYGATHASLNPLRVTLAVLAAAVLNAASNGLNQICDLTNDRINKPHRPLTSGRITHASGMGVHGRGLRSGDGDGGGGESPDFRDLRFAALATVAYSAPPVRLKRHPVGSNLIIALIRGWLLKVAGWAAVATVLTFD